MDFRYEFLGWPDDGPTIDISHERFAYAGKFILPGTGKAIVRSSQPGSHPIKGAVAFNDDRGVQNAARIRYITVSESTRGRRLGPKLALFVQDQIIGQSYSLVRIAVNNPIAYEAMYRAGFYYTGETRQLNEVVLSTDAPLSPSKYKTGLQTFDKADLPDRQVRLIDRGMDRGPPEKIQYAFNKVDNQTYTGQRIK